MTSLVGWKWLQGEHPGKKVYSVSEFLEEEISVRAVYSTEVEYDGVVLMNFNLRG